MRKVFILGACRTPIGKMGGSLASLSAVDLGSIVIKESLKRSGVPAETVDHVFLGCVIQAGLGQNVARQAALKAGLPNSTTAQTVNIVCGSGLDSVNSAARMIACGDADVVIAGGMESIEANEAFAAQSIAVINELDIPENKLNINGGAIALGHPVGASGCRILVTLLYALMQQKKETGLATLCIGDGMGCSTLIKRIEV